MRVTLVKNIVGCSSCGQDHTELVFKRIAFLNKGPVLPSMKAATHAAECPMTKQYVYLNENAE